MPKFAIGRFISHTKIERKTNSLKIHDLHWTYGFSRDGGPTTRMIYYGNF